MGGPFAVAGWAICAGPFAVASGPFADARDAWEVLGHLPYTRIYPGAAGATMRSRPGTKSYPQISELSTVSTTPSPGPPPPLPPPPFLSEPSRTRTGRSRAAGSPPITCSHVPRSSLARSGPAGDAACSPSTERLLVTRGWHRLWSRVRAHHETTTSEAGHLRLRDTAPEVGEGENVHRLAAGAAAAGGAAL